MNGVNCAYVCTHLVGVAFVAFLASLPAAADNTVPCGENPSGGRIDDGHPRSGRRWKRQHNAFSDALLNTGSQLNMAVYGDSITEDLAGMSDVLDRYRQDFKMDAFGISGDTSSNLLWRIQNGEFPSDMSPQFVVVHVGVNNILHKFEEEGQLDGKAEDSLAEHIADDILNVVSYIQHRSCRTQIMIQAILPTAWETRNVWPNRYSEAIDKANRLLHSKVGKHTRAQILDCTNVFLEGSPQRQRIRRDYMDDLLHPTVKGHIALADCVLKYSHAALQDVLERSAFLVFHDWGACSVPCGGGYQFRSSDCKLETNFIVGLERELSRRIGQDVCNTLSSKGQENLIQVCNVHPCTTPPTPHQMQSTNKEHHSEPLESANFWQTQPKSTELPPALPVRQHGPSLADWFGSHADDPSARQSAPPEEANGLQHNWLHDSGPMPNATPTQYPQAPAATATLGSGSINTNVRASHVLPEMYSYIPEVQQSQSQQGGGIPKFVFIAVAAICLCVALTICVGAAVFVCYLRSLREEQEQQLLMDVDVPEVRHAERQTAGVQDSNISASKKLKFRKGIEVIVSAERKAHLYSSKTSTSSSPRIVQQQQLSA